MDSPSIDSVRDILAAANAAPYAPARASGCGRAYVVLACPKPVMKLVAKACSALGLMFLKRAYGTAGNAIYIGYDNATGGPLGKAEAFAAKLNAGGISCYTDAVAD